MVYVSTGNSFAIARQPVGEQLGDWREKRHLGQLKLAEVAGISTRHLSFIETGRSVTSRDMVLRMAEQTDIPRPSEAADRA
jgi:transcriptional regulator with XRE-family HTH domain